MKAQIVAVKIPTKARIEINYADLFRVAVWLLKDLRDRTASGKDYQGVDFHAYSDKYQTYKDNKMSNIEGATPGKVTLMDTGKMIRSLKITRQGSFAVAYFALGDRARIGYWHQTGAGKLPKREWMNVSMKQRKEILAKLNKMIEIKKGGPVA